MTRKIKLSDKVGKVLYDLFPQAGGCNVLCLSDRELHIVRQFVYPYASWETRFVKSVTGQWYETAPEELYNEYKKVVESLYVKLIGGNMCCDAISELADAIRSLNPTVTVNCGCGGYSSSSEKILRVSDIVSLLERLEPNWYKGEEPLEVAEGTAPEGFETWAEYLDYKCKAANYIADTIINACQSLSIVNLGGIFANGGLAIVVTALGFIATAIPVATIFAIVSILGNMMIYSGMAHKLFGQLAELLRERRQNMVCAMYRSGSAADAIDGVSSVIEDAIQFLIFSGPLAGLGGVLTPLVGQVAALMLDNGLMNSLFRLVTDIVYEDVSCEECDEWAGHLIVTSHDYPYNVLVKGDDYYAPQTSADNGFLVVYGQTTKFYFTVSGEPITSITLQGEFYHDRVGWTVCDAGIYLASNNQQAVDFDMPLSNGGWRSYDSTKPCYLQPGQYYLGYVGTGGNQTWHRKIKMFAGESN